jgi:signal transduction histidine kinase
MNTPLAVLKGLMEKFEAPREGVGEGLSAAEAALMRRVVGRLERLSESLLDIARVRPHQARATLLRPLLDEAWTLVCLDRRPRGIDFINSVPLDLSAHADPDRLMQVFVNLLRNAVDATGEQPAEANLRIEAIGERLDRENTEACALSGNTGTGWASVRIRDNGPGIDSAVMPDLFQPFVSSRMDSHGTGLGLAVSEGIIREHTGVIIARNVSGPSGGAPCGAEFEVLIPSSGNPEEVNDHPHHDAIVTIAPTAHYGAAHA